MSNITTTRSRLTYIIGAASLLIIIALFGLLSYRLITGRSLGLRSFVSAKIYTVTNLPRTVLDSSSVQAQNQGDFTNIVFLHHSVGNNLIEQGEVREGLQEVGYDFWDHSYNHPGLRDPDGKYTGYSYNVPNDNTDPDGLARIFDQRVYDLPLNTLSGLMQHEVIAIKSCYPTSDIVNDEQLEQDKAWYLEMRDVMDQHPDKIFIILTQPPLNPASTTPEIAARANSLASWLSSDDFLDGHPNVFTFDFFHHLAESDQAAPDYYMLRQEFRQGTDSHPNQLANETIGPLFVNFIRNSVHTYRNQ